MCLTKDADTPAGVVLSESYCKDVPVDLYSTFSAMR